MYGQAARLIVVVWCILLPYYFAVDVFVHRFLPRYIESLPVARTLLLGVLFIGAIQILQSSLFNLYGKQKHFLLYSMIAMGFSLASAGMAVFVLHSLLLVAGVQVVSRWFVLAVQCLETQIVNRRVMARFCTRARQLCLVCRQFMAGVFLDF